MKSERMNSVLQIREHFFLLRKIDVHQNEVAGFLHLISVF